MVKKAQSYIGDMSLPRERGSDGVESDQRPQHEVRHHRWQHSHQSSGEYGTSDDPYQACTAVVDVV